MDNTITPESFLSQCVYEDEARAHREVILRDGDPYYDTEANTFERHHTPARALAECAAKRAILRDRARIDAVAGDTEWHMGYSDGNYDAVKALVAVYADRPGYSEVYR